MLIQTEFHFRGNYLFKVTKSCSQYGHFGSFTPKDGEIYDLASGLHFDPNFTF